MELTCLGCGKACACRYNGHTNRDVEIRTVVQFEGHNSKSAICGTLYISGSSEQHVTTILVKSQGGKSSSTVSSGVLAEASNVLISGFDGIAVGSVAMVSSTGKIKESTHMSLIDFKQFSARNINAAYRLRLTTLAGVPDLPLCRDLIQSNDGQWWSCLIDPPSEDAPSAQDGSHLAARSSAERIVDDSTVWLHPVSRTAIIADLLTIIKMEVTDHHVS